MEKINGVSFEDWAAGVANLTHGMPVEEVCNILGIEIPVWESTNKSWGEKMADIAAADMSIAQKYAAIFQNPKVGKFANAGSTMSIEEVLVKVPTLKSLELNRAQSNPMAIAKSYNNLGNVYLQNNQNQKAVSFYHKAIQINQKHQIPNPNPLASLAKYYLQVDSLDLAFTYFEKAFILSKAPSYQLEKADKLLKIALRQKDHVQS